MKREWLLHLLFWLCVFTAFWSVFEPWKKKPVSDGKVELDIDGVQSYNK